MKRNLLFVAALFAASVATAQEIGVIDTEQFTYVDFTKTNSKGETETEQRANLVAGTQIASTASVTVSVLYTDDFKATGLAQNDVTVNDADLGSKSGLQGNTNPSATATTGTYPESGAIFTFTPSADGYLYVIHKASASKNYVVWESKTRIPYYFAMQDDKAAEDMIVYDLNNVEGATVTDANDPTIVNIADDYAILKAREYVTGREASTIGGTGVIKFPVYNGSVYDVHATGSKLTLAGFVFSTADDVTIKTTTEGNANTLYAPEGTTNIKVVNVSANGDITAPAYNMVGQRVNRNAKGLVIVNGKKFINK